MKLLTGIVYGSRLGYFFVVLRTARQKINTAAPDHAAGAEVHWFSFTSEKIFLMNILRWGESSGVISNISLGDLQEQDSIKPYPDFYFEKTLTRIEYADNKDLFTSIQHARYREATLVLLALVSARLRNDCGEREKFFRVGRRSFEKWILDLVNRLHNVVSAKADHVKVTGTNQAAKRQKFRYDVSRERRKVFRLDFRLSLLLNERNSFSLAAFRKLNFMGGWVQKSTKMISTLKRLLLLFHQCRSAFRACNSLIWYFVCTA